MNPDEIKAKAATLAELYTAKAAGKVLQRGNEEDGWFDTPDGFGPDMMSDLSMWRVKPEPRRMWKAERGGIETDSETKAQEWRGLGYTVTEWQEVLP